MAGQTLSHIGLSRKTVLYESQLSVECRFSFRLTTILGPGMTLSYKAKTRVTGV